MSLTWKSDDFDTHCWLGDAPEAALASHRDSHHNQTIFMGLPQKGGEQSNQAYKYYEGKSNYFYSSQSSSFVPSDSHLKLLCLHISFHLFDIYTYKCTMNVICEVN